jgi:hypothetical protein
MGQSRLALPFSFLAIIVVNLLLESCVDECRKKEKSPTTEAGDFEEL